MATAPTKNRLVFIDTIRSIAILMMLEGHFITHSIQKTYRDNSSEIYGLWKFTRGLTAPVFLTISGLIFTYLLLNDKNKGFQNKRLKKGFNRALLLLILGFSLQIKIYKVLFLGIPWFTELFYIFHVLHVIGTSMILIIGLYLLQNYILKIPFGIIIGLAAISIFLLTPTLYEINYDAIPRFIENILITSKDTSIKVSVFPIFPWAGFVFAGATLGYIIYKLQHRNLGIGFALILLITGLTLHNFSYNILVFIQSKIAFLKLTPVDHVYEFCRFGHVLMVISAVLFLEKTVPYIRKKLTIKISNNTQFLLFSISIFAASLLSNIQTESPILIALPYLLFFTPIVLAIAKAISWDKKLFHQVGQNTLMIYVLHVILLYEGFLGLQIGKLIKANLTPFYSISGMIIFVTSFVLLVKHYDMLKNYMNNIVSLRRIKIQTYYLPLRRLRRA